MLKFATLMPEDGETTLPRRQPRASSKDLLVVTLAAGQGKRLHLSVPKIFHPLAGEPLIHYPIQLARQLGARTTVVVHAVGQETLLAPLAQGLALVPQHRPLGTGHAVNQVPQALRAPPEVLVLYGDVPLLTLTTVRRLIQLRRRNGLDCALLGANMSDPTGYGRLVEESNGRVHIVEESEATPGEAALHMVNTGVCCFSAEALWPALRPLKNSSRTRDDYLTHAFASLERPGVLAFHDDD